MKTNTTAAPTAFATWHHFLSANPEMLLRFALVRCAISGIQAVSRAEIAAEAAQGAAVALLARPIAGVENPITYAYAVVRSEVARARGRWLPEKQHASPEVLDNLPASAPVEPIEAPALDAVRNACGEALFRYVQAEMEMPEADRAAKAERVGVAAKSYPVGLCRARAKCREVLV